MRISGSSLYLSTRPAATSNALDMNYLYKALGKTMVHKLKPFLFSTGGRLSITHFPQAKTPRQKIDFTHAEQMVPPLILIRPEEINKFLSFYPVTISSHDSDSYREACAHSSLDEFFAFTQDEARITLQYLDCFLLVVKEDGRMIMIMDDHTYGAYALALAKEIGLIRNPVLFNFDQHKDNIVNHPVHDLLDRRGQHRFSLGEVAAYTQTSLQINQWIMFACKIGLLKKEDIYYILTEYLQQRKPSLLNSRSLKEAISEMTKVKRAGKDPVFSYDLDLLAYQFANYCEVNTKDVKTPKGEIVATLKEAARSARLSFIATSPDYFNADISIIRERISEIVQA